MRTDKARKRRSGGGDHLSQRLIGAIGGNSLSKRLGHQAILLGLNWHSHTEFAEIRLQGRFIDDGRLYTRGTPTIRSRFGFLDNGGELEMGGLVLIDAAAREDGQKQHEHA
ncbi:hypothetical protein NR798_07190 [Archangium gephyra]|uniref:hypothetical protein n=1 Tax=Archangium gephyra TaxID=48 RepID=UPI0035D3F95B